MANIGEFRFPRYDFETAIECTKVLVKDFNGEINNQENFAQALGHSNAKSGSYRRKRADLKKFGLVDNSWSATDLARKLVHPKNPDEEKEAKFEALKNIELLDKIYEYTDGEYPEDDFWIKISEVADTTPGEAKDNSDVVSKLYKNMLEFEPENSPESESDKTKDHSQSEENISTDTISEDIKLRLVDSDGNKFDVREEKDLPVAKAFFESRISEIEQGDKK